LWRRKQLHVAASCDCACLALCSASLHIWPTLVVLTVMGHVVAVQLGLLLSRESPAICYNSDVFLSCTCKCHWLAWLVMLSTTCSANGLSLPNSTCCCCQQQRVPIRQYVPDVVRTLSTQYVALSGPVRSGSTLLLLLLLAALLPSLTSSGKCCWPVPGLQTVFKHYLLIFVCI
jgi:hypothetical protein